MKSVNKSRQTVAVMIAVLMAVSALALVADISDADVTMNQSGITAVGFKDGSAGTLNIPVTNNDSLDNEVTLNISENGKTVIEQVWTLKANQSITLNPSFELSKGHHNVTVSLSGDGISGTLTCNVDIDVGGNLWRNTSTYVAIAVIVIVIVAAVLIYNRSKPKVKPTTTFTQLEEEKRAASKEQPQQTASTQKKKYGSDDEGKIKYTSSRRK